LPARIGDDAVLKRFARTARQRERSRANPQHPFETGMTQACVNHAASPSSGHAASLAAGLPSPARHRGSIERLLCFLMGYDLACADRTGIKNRLRARPVGSREGLRDRVKSRTNWVNMRVSLGQIPTCEHCASLASFRATFQMSPKALPFFDSGFARASHPIGASREDSRSCPPIHPR
jgi:hypothetical protein